MLVISADGKGIVIRPEALRAATAKAAAAATTKLATRLSKGEKRSRQRMAEVGAVDDLTPVPRCSADVLTSDKHDQDLPPAPKAKNKWVTASVVDDAAAVIAAIFDQAQRRDPDQARTWVVALVDGNNHQVERIHAEADTRGVAVTILIDLVHVLEYLWGAAWCFFPEGNPGTEAWVRGRALAILDGHARQVAAGIRRRATASKLPSAKRRKADACATYLLNKARYLDYPRALAAGWPLRHRHHRRRLPSPGR